MRNCIICLLVFFFSISVDSQTNSFSYVDRNGILRWQTNNKEIRAFGVNYILPFSLSYDTHKKLNISIKESIDADVYHFTRMGVDVFRVHMWDNEISDSLGNLVCNEQLHWFDYLLYKLKQNNIKVFLTPLSFNISTKNNKRNGFATFFNGKNGCLLNREAYHAQERYLKQLMTHINEFTKQPYCNDKNIIAYEICNEPNVKWNDKGLLKEYINRMTNALKCGGSKVPILYNISGSVDFADNICSTQINGITCQWYPTGLFERRKLKGNYIQNVDKYNLDIFNNLDNFNNKARFIYEFSPSSVEKNVTLFPAMARSFCEKGFQVATYFAYDAMNLADKNICYPSHFLNLIYTPRQTLSMKIASEIFHKLPLNKDFGHFPDNLNFYGCHLNVIDDKVSYLSNDKFLYTGDNDEIIKNVNKLKDISGIGNSRIVKYSGNGIYFLDKLKDGLWRLEVMPDVMEIYDPMTISTIAKKNIINLWNENKISILLPDLKKNYFIKNLKTNSNNYADNFNTTVTPGIYLIGDRDDVLNTNIKSAFKTFHLDTYFAPKTNCDKLYINYDIPKNVLCNSSNKVSLNVASPKKIKQVDFIFVDINKKKNVVKGIKKGNNEYYAYIPSDMLQKENILKLYLSIFQIDGVTTLPSNLAISASDKEFYANDGFLINVINNDKEVKIFDCLEDYQNLIAESIKVENNISFPSNNERLSWIFKPNNTKYNHFSERLYIYDKIKYRINHDTNKRYINVYASTLDNKPCDLELSLLMNDGRCYSYVLNVKPKQLHYIIDINSFILKSENLIPCQFPSFQNKQFIFNKLDSTKIDLSMLESLQFSIDSKSDGLAISHIAIN